MARPPKSRKSRREAAKKGHLTRKANSRRWLLESFAPRSTKSCGWDRTGWKSSAIEDIKPTESADQPQNQDLAPDSTRSSVNLTQQGESPSTEESQGPNEHQEETNHCAEESQRPCEHQEEREEAQQPGAGTEAERSDYNNPRPNPTQKSDLEMDTQSVLENFAPHSCVNSNTCRPYRTYDSNGTGAESSQCNRHSSQYNRPITNSGCPRNDAGPNVEPSPEPDQNPVGQPATHHSPCRQTARRRKKREETKNEPSNWAGSEPGASHDDNPQHDTDLKDRELSSAIQKWPRGRAAKDANLKNRILDAAICDMQQLLNSRPNRPEGQDYTRHKQVLMFMQAQKERPFETRVNLAMEVANRFQKRHRVQRRILGHEKMWVKERRIPEGGQGRVKKGHVLSVLQDDGTVKVDQRRGFC